MSWYSYELYSLDNIYISKGVVLANSKEEANQTVFVNNKEKFVVKNVKQIENNDNNKL